MEFEYEIGELVISGANGDIYQIVKRLHEIPTDKKEEKGPRYYARRITVHRYDFKPEKAVLFHPSWLYKSKKVLDKFNASMTKEIKEYLDNIVFEPEYYFTYFCFFNHYAHFFVNKSDFGKVKNIFESIPFSMNLLEDGERELQKLLSENILREYDFGLVTKSDLAPNEIICRLDIYRYRDDYVEPDNYLSPEFYRCFKVKKIYLK